MQHGHVEVVLGNCEVEILGESIRLEPALAEARAALERLRSRHLVLGDSGEQPAEDVVLLDDVVGELPLIGCVCYFALRNHAETSAFTRRPQWPDLGPCDGSAGSRSDMPEVIG